MRILLTVHQFFPQFSAGTEVLTLSVARELIGRGHTVHVLTGHPGSTALAEEDRFDEYDYERIHVYRFYHAYIPMAGQKSMIEVDYDNRLGAAYFARILMNYNPDLVHFFHLNRLGSGMIEQAVKAGIPCFMTPTDFWSICPMGQLLLPDGSLCTGPNAYAGNCLKHFAQIGQKGLSGKIAKFLPTVWADLLVRFTQNFAFPYYSNREEVAAISNRLAKNVSRLNQLNGLATPTKFISNLLVRHGVLPDLIREISFGIEVNRHVLTHKKLSENRVPLRVGFIGTLAPHKGCHILVEAIKTLPSDSFSLKIYGHAENLPDYMAQLELLVGNHKSIEFCGTFPNPKISQVFEGIDVLVIPSVWYENTPLVLFSAQSAQCPVVASNLPGLAEVIDNEQNGLLFAPGSSSDLARQISRLIYERGLLQRLTERSKSPKSIQKYVDELLAMWKGQAH